MKGACGDSPAGRSGKGWVVAARGPAGDKGVDAAGPVAAAAALAA